MDNYYEIIKVVLEGAMKRKGNKYNVDLNADVIMPMVLFLKDLTTNYEFNDNIKASDVVNNYTLLLEKVYKGIIKED